MSATVTYAICKACGRPMDGSPCLLTHYVMGDDTELARLPYVKLFSGMADRCNDCGVIVGELHHPPCDLEQCPACLGQNISCDCP